MDDMVVPDRIGEVLGWRAWQVIGERHFPLLASVTHRSTIWHPDRWTFATCNEDATCTKMACLGDTIPGVACSCGLYAAASRAQLVGLGYPRQTNVHRPVFIGQVAMAGKVVPGSQGWRAQKGRIAELLVPHVHWHYVEGLEQMYRVPVVLDNTVTVPKEVM